MPEPMTTKIGVGDYILDLLQIGAAILKMAMTS